MVNTLLKITAASQLLIHSSLFPGWLSMQAKQIDISRDTLSHFASYFYSFMSLKVYEYTSESLFSFSGVVLYSLQTQWFQLCQFMCNAHRKHLLSFSFLKGMESTLLSQIFICLCHSSKSSIIKCFILLSNLSVLSVGKLIRLLFLSISSANI